MHKSRRSSPKGHFQMLLFWSKTPEGISGCKWLHVGYYSYDRLSLLPKNHFKMISSLKFDLWGTFLHRNTHKLMQTRHSLWCKECADRISHCGNISGSQWLPASMGTIHSSYGGKNVFQTLTRIISAQLKCHFPSQGALEIQKPNCINLY